MKTNGTHARATQAPEPVNAPGYTALRMAADWASAVRGVPVHLAYDPGTGHVKAATVAGAELTLETRAFTTRPEVTGVEFVVPTGEGTATAQRTLDGHQASALFWGESAVEKFLVPRYASAAAYTAADFLDRLFAAWYEYPGQVVQVCALAHLMGTRAPAPGTQLSLADTVGLVCLERATGHLLLLTLDEFTARYTPGQPVTGAAPEPAGPPQAEKGWTVNEGVESVVARDVAEFVSGVRGRLVAFMSEGDKLNPALFPSDQPSTEPLPAGTFRLAALARRVRGDRPAPARVTVLVRDPGGAPVPYNVVPEGVDPATTPDCMFWSDGAVEQLMLPYYASVKGAGSPYFIEVLMRRWDGLLPPGGSTPDVVPAMRRRLPERFGEDPRSSDEEPPSTVFSITHLPRSEYATYPGGLETRIVLLALERETGRTVSRVVRYDLFGGAPLPEPGAGPRYGVPGAAGDAGAVAAPARRSRKRTSRAR